VIQSCLEILQTSLSTGTEAFDGCVLALLSNFGLVIVSKLLLRVDCPLE